MRKDFVENECRRRNICYEGKLKKDAVSAFNEMLAGINRVPALCFLNRSLDWNLPQLKNYEVAPCEPLHDLKEHIRNLWVELPLILFDGKCANSIALLLPF